MKTNVNKALPRCPVEYADCPKWVRVYLGGVCVADSKRVVLVRERGMFCFYYFPREDINMELLAPAGNDAASGKTFWTVKTGEAAAEKAAFAYPGRPEIKDHITFEWNKMDTWFEEDEVVRVHARDPYTRLDVLASSREIRAVIDGLTVAESRRPALLFETGLKTRYYLPRTDVRLDLLVPGKTESFCHYKGTASYYSMRVNGKLFEDVIWYYAFPNPNMSRIKDLFAFYQEKLDEFYVDGENIAGR
jgi:uncharacterized protein (DUF427 family)